MLKPAVNFPILDTAGVLTIRNVASLEIPTLRTVNGIIFKENNFRGFSMPNLDTMGFISISACSYLETISFPNVRSLRSELFHREQLTQSLQVIDNPLLKTISFPQLTLIRGDLVISNNIALSEINGFYLVNAVEGNIDLTGSFNAISLPLLWHVGGGVNVQTSSNTFLCPFSEIRSNGVVKGYGFICSGKIEQPVPGVNGTNQTADCGRCSALCPLHFIGNPDISGIGV